MTIVLEADDDFAGLIVALEADLNPADDRLAERLPHTSAFDAVIDGITNHVKEGGRDLVKDLATEMDLCIIEDEGDILAQFKRKVIRGLAEQWTQP